MKKTLSLSAFGLIFPALVMGKLPARAATHIKNPPKSAWLTTKHYTAAPKHFINYLKNYKTPE